MHANTHVLMIWAKTDSPNCLKLLPSKNRSIHCWEVWVKNTIHTPLMLSCLCRGERNNLVPVKRRMQPVFDWKWQRGFLSMFEEQLLTFTTKSYNMLSATSGLCAWQSLGFSVIMEIFVDVSVGREPRGAFTRPTIKPFLSFQLPSLCWIPPSAALWSFLSL